MTGKTEKLEYVEKLVLRSMGAYGYLKFPRAFIDKYRHDKTRIPDPDAYLTENPETGKIELTFAWSKDEIEDAKRVVETKESKKSGE